MILPHRLAPVQVVVVPILYKGKKEEEVLRKCRDLLAELKKAGIRARLDEREKTPGEKFYYWEMKGVPIRAEIGPRDVERGEVTLVRRDTGEKIRAKGDVSGVISKLGEELERNLRKKVQADLKNSIREAKTLEETIKALKDKMIARAPLCSRELDGQACAEKIKEMSDGGQVRGTLFPEPEKPGKAVCIVCGKPAKAMVYIAKAY